MQDALIHSVAFGLIGLQFQAVALFLLDFPLAVRTHVQAWPRFILVSFPPTSDVAADCFGCEVCQCCSLSGDRSCKLIHNQPYIFEILVGPSVVTAVTCCVQRLGVQHPMSTLASSSMMRSACALHFSSSAAAYFIADAKLSSAVVAVAPPWGVSMV